MPLPDALDRAHAAIRSGDLRLAEELAQQSLREAPGTADGYMILGTALAAQGRSAEAVGVLRSAVELAPGSADASLALGR